MSKWMKLSSGVLTMETLIEDDIIHRVYIYKIYLSM